MRRVLSRKNGDSSCADMLIQVIHCHPLTDSYNHALFQTTTTALEDKGHRVAATNLYREQFDPNSACCHGLPRLLLEPAA